MADEGFVVVNPLPRTLDHYLRALRVLLGERFAPRDVMVPNVEVGDHGRLSKFFKRVRPVVQLLRVALFCRLPVLILWPSLGLGELALWRMSRGAGRRRLIVIHDPVPLRRQFGFGPIGHLFGAWGSRCPYVEVIAHTALAAGHLEEMGIRVSHILPHPLLPPKSRTAQDGPVVVQVAGQHKESRDVALLRSFAEVSPRDWELRISGNGWEQVQGWKVVNRFLTEEELDETLSRASVVLIPYRYYFQSGIAVRSFELGVPVVASRHEFIENLYGSDWPGIVDDGTIANWINAVDRVAGLNVRTDIGYAQRQLVCWQTALRVGEGSMGIKNV